VKDSYKECKGIPVLVQKELRKNVAFPNLKKLPQWASLFSNKKANGGSE